MRKFLTRLFSNPNFTNQPLTLVEQFIIGFIDKNAAGLTPLFKAPEYFPDKDWPETRKLLITELQNMILEELKPKIKTLIQNNIDFSAIGVLINDEITPSGTYFDEIWEYCEKIFHQPEVRFHIDNAGRLLQAKTIDLYVHTAWEKRSYTYNELFKVDHIKQDADQYTELLKIALVIRAGSYIPVPQDMNNLTRGTVSYTESRNNPAKLKNFTQNLRSLLVSSLPKIPDKIIDIVIDSFQNFNEDPDISAAGRFLNIMAARAKDLRLNQKVAKGADTPDKSWFSIAARNSRFLGLDKRLLEDLNRTAFELRK